MSHLSEPEKFGGETDSREVFRRLAGCWTYWGWKSGCFNDEEAARNYYFDMCYMLAGQMVRVVAVGRKRSSNAVYCPVNDTWGR